MKQLTARFVLHLFDPEEHDEPDTAAYIRKDALAEAFRLRLLKGSELSHRGRDVARIILAENPNPASHQDLYLERAQAFLDIESAIDTVNFLIGQNQDLYLFLTVRPTDPPCFSVSLDRRSYPVSTAPDNPFDHE